MIQAIAALVHEEAHQSSGKGTPDSDLPVTFARALQMAVARRHGVIGASDRSRQPSLVSDVPPAVTQDAPTRDVDPAQSDDESLKIEASEADIDDSRVAAPVLDVLHTFTSRDMPARVIGGQIASTAFSVRDGDTALSPGPQAKIEDDIAVPTGDGPVALNEGYGPRHGIEDQRSSGNHAAQPVVSDRADESLQRRGNQITERPASVAGAATATHERTATSAGEGHVSESTDVEGHGIVSYARGSDASQAITTNVLDASPASIGRDGRIMWGDTHDDIGRRPGRFDLRNPARRGRPASIMTMTGFTNFDGVGDLLSRADRAASPELEQNPFPHHPSTRDVRARDEGGAGVLFDAPRLSSDLSPEVASPQIAPRSDGGVLPQDGGVTINASTRTVIEPMAEFLRVTGVPQATREPLVDVNGRAVQYEVVYGKVDHHNGDAMTRVEPATYTGSTLELVKQKAVSMLLREPPTLLGTSDLDVFAREDGGLKIKTSTRTVIEPIEGAFDHTRGASRNVTGFFGEVETNVAGSSRVSGPTSGLDRGTFTRKEQSESGDVTERNRPIGVQNAHKVEPVDSSDHGYAGRIAAVADEGVTADSGQPTQLATGAPQIMEQIHPSQEGRRGPMHSMIDAPSERPLIDQRRKPAMTRRGDTASLRVEGADGNSTVIRVTVLGDRVRTSIVHPDKHAAAQMAAGSDQLRDALHARGLHDVGVTIQSRRGMIDMLGTTQHGDHQPSESRDYRDERQPDREAQHDRHDDSRGSKRNREQFGRRHDLRRDQY